MYHRNPYHELSSNFIFKLLGFYISLTTLLTSISAQTLFIDQSIIPELSSLYIRIIILAKLIKHSSSKVQNQGEYINLSLGGPISP